MHNIAQSVNRIVLYICIASIIFLELFMQINICQIWVFSLISCSMTYIYIRGRPREATVDKIAQSRPVDWGRFTNAHIFAITYHPWRMISLGAWPVTGANRHIAKATHSYTSLFFCIISPEASVARLWCIIRTTVAKLLDIGWRP